MPTITRRPRPPRQVTANGNAPGVGAPIGDIPPEEVAAIRQSVGSPEQGPSTQALSAYPTWKEIMDQLGDPYNTELIPISKLRMMRRDPIIGFGLSFIKTPHVRARWYIDAKDSNGPNAQVAAHLDHDLRRIMASFVLQWSNSLDFGFQALARRFEFGIPSGTYVGPGSDGTPTNLPIWDNGNIQPIRWKPFVALRPEAVDPVWGTDGSFNGISYDGADVVLPGGTGAVPAEGEEQKQNIDLYHSLWITNERDQNFGSIFGYPRLGYCNPPEAPILMGDYSLKPIGEVQEGDEVIGWEKKFGRRASGKVAPRNSLSRSIVKEVSKFHSKIVKVTFESGKTIRCTPDHLWLLYGRSGEFGPPKEGGTLSRVLDIDGDKPITYDQLSEDHKVAANWLGGIYDGEGSGSYIAQDVHHNPEVYDRICESLEALDFDYSCNEESIWIKGGREELMRFARLTRVTRIDALDRVILGHRFQRPEKIASVEPDGEGEVVALTTTTGNYVAWGLASKNCYRYWWSYWFRWSITDRAFEKKADPSIIIKHPEGQFIDPTSGVPTLYSDYALTIGTRMRSGGIITVPSTPYEGVNGPIGLPEWDISFTNDMTSYDPFDKSFDYLDIGKIRSLWIPEQSLVEGKGGTSSRNVAAELDSSFTESQAVMSVQIQETVNRWIIPQWIAINYPEFVGNQGSAQLVIQGFADEDVAFTQQILQLLGQQTQGVNKLLTMVDLQKILDDAGVPLLDIKAQADAQTQLVQTLQAQVGPSQGVQPQAGKNGSVGVVPSSEVEGQPSATEDTGGTSGDNQPSVTGFTYVQPREVIYLTRDEVYGENPKIKVKRIPTPTDGVIARFDPDEMTVFLADSVSDTDADKYLTEIGKVLIGDSSGQS
jgi:hypothetical protein